MGSPISVMKRWAVKHERTNKLDGHRVWFSGGLTELFATRRECQAHIKERYGYIAKRKDLRVEPHCWRVPKAVKVSVIVRESATREQ